MIQKFDETLTQIKDLMSDQDFIILVEDLVIRAVIAEDLKTKIMPISK
jgi:hypothetical protein